MAENNKTVLYQCGRDAKTETNTADPVTTEVIRSALVSVASQMATTLTLTITMLRRRWYGFLRAHPWNRGAGRIGGGVLASRRYDNAT